METDEPIERVRWGWHTNPKFRALQIDVQAWIEKQRLSDGTCWWPTLDWRLSLTSDGELQQVLYCANPLNHPDAVRVAEKYRRLREELDTIVAKHGCYVQCEETSGRVNRGVHFLVAEPA